MFHILSQAQDWATGQPVKEKRKGVRSVPLEIGTRRGLIMSYLPDKANAGRLCPSMVCQADAWERLSVKADQRKKK